MAFGFGFNKQKVLSAAEKFVQQGKLQNAITEYEKILKADPKDLTVMNTVGDLYARLGESDHALDCFKSVGDAYASQGFTVKAIAMYKKVTKTKTSLETVLRLAELYTQQGLFNDARAQYLQVAEEFLRAGELEQAVRIFQKTLEMDPENAAMRMKLADVYVRLGKKNEAWQIYTAAAESLRARGALEQAEDILQRMVKLEPTNSYALLMRGRTAFDAGDLAAAIENLERVPDLDSHPEGLRSLFQAYLQTGHLAEAGPLASKLAAVHNDTVAIFDYTDALVASGQVEDALQVYEDYSDRLLSVDSAKVLENLRGLIGPLSESPAGLEVLLSLFQKAGESAHVTEVYELLAHAYVQSGEFEKARDYYFKLTQLEPQNQLHAANYQQVLAKLGGTVSGGRLITAEEGAVLVDELEATAPFVEQRYPDELALAIRAALTDAELFVSYNMPAKALGPLLSALPRAPRDLRLNQRLAALHTRAGRFGEASSCCRTLASIYHEAGHPNEALRYSELAAKYEERASVTSDGRSATDSDLAAQAAAAVSLELSEKSEMFFQALEEEVPFLEAPDYGEVEDLPVANASLAPPPALEFEVPSASAEEVDLSEEWDGPFDEPPAPPATAPEHINAHQAPAQEEKRDKRAIAFGVEEVRFYLDNDMVEEAMESLRKLGELRAEAAILAMLQAEVTEARMRADQAQAPQVEKFQASDVEEFSVVDEAPIMDVPDIQADANMAAVVPIVPLDLPPAPVEVQEFAVAQDQVEEFAVPPAGPNSPGGMLDDFVSDLESSLGEDFFTAPAPPLAPLLPEPPPEPGPTMVPVAETEDAAIMSEHSDPLGDFVADLETSLGEKFVPDVPASNGGHAIPSVPRFGAQPDMEAPSASVEVPLHATEALPSALSIPASRAAAASIVPGAPTAAPTVLSSVTYQPIVRPISPPVGAGIDLEAGVNLTDMFDELKYELDEGVAAGEEDPETHYNLGVAFREMGLLDEAIGELQKVCTAVEKGHGFPLIMQTYTWLAQCFLDKGVPEAAVRWYERALKLPSLDTDTRVALHYELASSYETAKNKPAALQHFMEVYGNNIDYRDVSERIKALKS